MHAHALARMLREAQEQVHICTAQHSACITPVMRSVQGGVAACSLPPATHAYTHPQVLVDAKADVHHADKGGWTGLAVAALGGHDKTVEVRIARRYGKGAECIQGG